MHRGIDFASATPGRDYSGAKIFAMADGVVIEGRERQNVSGFGGWVWLRHSIAGQVVDTIYGHMYQNKIHVTKGDRVTRGQHIADVGDNGDVDGAHLHAEVWTTPGRVGGTAVDPTPWLIGAP